MKRWACIARFGGIGDTLVASSVFRPLKRLGYMTEMITDDRSAVLFTNNPYLDKLSIKKDGDIPGGPDWQKWFAMRTNEYDILVNLSNSQETRHALHRDSTAFWWPVEYRREMCAGSYLETAHKIVGVPFEFGPLFFPTEDERQKAEDTIRTSIRPRYLAWVLAGSRLDKLYPYIPHAICRIIKELDIPVLMVGVGEHQFNIAEQIKEDVRKTNGDRDLLFSCVSHEGMPEEQRWGIRTALCLALRADLVVTPDTGVAWAVALEQMPKVVMVSHASAENITKNWVNTTTLHADRNRVPCWPCHRLHDDPSTCVAAKAMNGTHTAACMADISVEDIVRAVDNSWRPADNVRVLREAAE